jgi:hypothetical protein
MASILDYWILWSLKDARQDLFGQENHQLAPTILLKHKLDKKVVFEEESALGAT